MRNKILFSCVLMIGLMAPASSAEEDILIITEEWPPYNYTVDGKITGFATEIVQNILKVMKKNYKIKILPAVRSTTTLNRRPRTMFYALFRTPERESKYKWIIPLGDASISFYKRRDNPLKFESLDDMKNRDLSVCCRQTGLIPDLLVEKGFQNLDSSATMGISIYRKLIIGRCDLAISDADLGVRYILKSLNVKMDVVEKIPIPIFEAEMYLVGTKDISDEEIQHWQSALEALKTKGVYEKILQTYQ